MDSFVQLPPDRRRQFCNEAQAKLGLHAVSIEKDFWVCWILRELFQLPEWGGHLLNAKNESFRQPQLNLHIAKAYLAGTDSGVSTRTWQDALNAIIETKIFSLAPDNAE